METIKDFNEYEILAMSNGYKYERWNNITLKRPDPEIIWPDNENIKVDARYTRSNTGGGMWEKLSNIPDSWQIHYKDLVFNLKLMGFKHTGLFPEQAYNWDLIRKTIKNSNRKCKVLNLFAYTGAASIAALKEGAEVVHVDSSRGMIDWAKENVKSNHLENETIRFLVDDVKKFVKRELRRGNKYDIILMDPPSFGRGAKNEVWSIEKDLYNLVDDCTKLLSDKPLLFIINSYTTGLSNTVIENILHKTITKEGTITSTELGIKAKNNLILPCGNTTRWEANATK
ncbi:MAG: class I SAM-dependent methyltransferase [Bacilli bacterium]|nr:class I SAM-dependent methyltransferase [bacterium]MDY3756733.1 class I SAM-dependent methyltransferase [Bacilli bacterium]